MAERVSARLSAAEAGRRFGFTVGGALAALALVAWWRGHRRVATVLGGLATLLFLAALVVPASLGPVEELWMAMARGMSRVTTPLVLGAFFYLIITPIGIARRILRRGGFRHTAPGTSAWVERPAGRRRSDLQRQF